MTPVQKMITVSFRDGSEASFAINSQGELLSWSSSCFPLWRIYPAKTTTTIYALIDICNSATELEGAVKALKERHLT